MTPTRWLYRTGIGLYGAAIRVAAIWQRKARLWTEGRADLWQRVDETAIRLGRGAVWFHCSSLGEFEMARPVMEQLRSIDPSKKMILTFFSPSGYEVRKNSDGADAVLYLPLDTQANAIRFIGALRPSSAVFVKYDLWWELLAECRRNDVPVHLICAAFRQDQLYFRFPDAFGRPILSNITWFHTIDAKSCELLQSLGMDNCTICGDTRYDRVMQIARAAVDVELILHWKGTQKLIVCGSTWPADETVLAPVVNGSEHRWLIVPHEVHPEALARVRERFPEAISYTELISGAEADVVIMDRIGLLSRCYRHADVAYVGGAFGSGLHNILEATAHGVPVVFGPQFHRFADAVDMSDKNLCISIHDSITLQYALDQFLIDKETIRPHILSFMTDREGATDKIVRRLVSDVNR